MTYNSPGVTLVVSVVVYICPFSECFCFDFRRSTICIYIHKNPVLFFFLFQNNNNPKQRQTTQFRALNCSSFILLIHSESPFLPCFISSIITYISRFRISLDVDLTKNNAFGSIILSAATITRFKSAIVHLVKSHQQYQL